LKSSPNLAPDYWKDKHTFFLFCIYIVLVLFATLFPFDFSSKKATTLIGTLQAVEWDLISWSALIDFPRNIVLFIPFGFASAYHLRKWGVPAAPTVLIALAAGTMFSFTIEILQQSISLRFSAIADTAANSAGTFVGIAAFFLFGNQLMRAVARFLRQSWQQLSSPILLLLTICYTLLILAAAALLQNTSSLAQWSSVYPLALGNEPTGDRPWQGRVAEVFLANRALDQNEVQQVMNGVPTQQVAGNALFTRYHFSGEGPYSDQLGNLSSLYWQGSTFEEGRDSSGALIEEGHWLKTSAPVDSLTRQIQLTSQFTLSLIAAPSSDTLSGPARILTISGDTKHSNLSLSQEGKDLVIRLRNGVTGENGRHPELIVPGVWSGSEQRHIILTYDASTARVYIDDVQTQYIFEFSPEVALFWRLSLADTGGIRLNSNHQLIVKLLFYGMVFIPFGWLLLMWQKHAQAEGVWKLIFVIPGALLPSILFQAVLAWVPRGSGSRWDEFLFGVFFTILAMLYFQDFGKPFYPQNIKERSGERISFV
jgi:glycopeptide antibiotics resistance protein